MIRIVRPSLWSLGQKLRWLVIVPPSLAVLLLTGGVLTKLSMDEMENQANQVAEAKIDDLKLRVEGYFDRADVLTRCISARQKLIGRNPDPSTMAFLRALLEATPKREAQGVYIAFEDKDYREKDAIQWLDRNNNSQIHYDYHDARNEQSAWYRGAKAKDETEYAVSKPYFDKGGANITMVSVTRPIKDAKGSLIGVAGVDLDMTELIQVVREFAFGSESGESSEAYLVSDNKYVFAYPEQASEQPYLLLERTPEGRYVKSQARGFRRVQSNSGKWRRISWTSSSKISGWKVVRSIPDEDVDSPLYRMASLSFTIGLLFLALMIGIVSVVVNWVTGPITKLTAAAAAVEAGDYRPDGISDIAQRRDEFGQLARGFRRMVEEVSAREQQLRQTQDELSHRERHYRGLIENATDLVTIINPDGTVLYKSPSVKRLLGYTSDELVGRSSLEFIHPDDRVSARENTRRLANHPGTHIQAEYRFRHKDGSWRTFEALCSDLLEDPAVAGIVINGRDITERKQAETEILQLNAELEERVRRRTAELEQKNEELCGAKDATEQAMKQQEIFLSNVAHDLRTPLTIVIGYSEDLLRRVKKQGHTAFIPDLKLIANRGKDLLELINDLLNLSKAISDKGIELEIEPFDIEEMVRGRMEGIGTIAQKYGNTIEFNPEPGLGTMIADKAKVWRVLMNLLSNACKFTKDGTITTTAGRIHDGNGDWIVFRVADTGIGMGREEQSRLFNRFSQVHATSGKLLDGVGLGLSICMFYCKAMGGQIVVASEEGRGSTFTVTLPAEFRPTVRPSSAAEISAVPPVPTLAKPFPATGA